MYLLQPDSPISTKTKQILPPSARKKKAGGRRSSPAGESIRRPPLGACRAGRGHGVPDHPHSFAKYYAIKCLAISMPTIIGRSL